MAKYIALLAFVFFLSLSCLNEIPLDTSKVSIENISMYEIDTVRIFDNNENDRSKDNLLTSGEKIASGNIRTFDVMSNLSYNVEVRYTNGVFINQKTSLMNKDQKLSLIFSDSPVTYAYISLKNNSTFPIIEAKIYRNSINWNSFACPINPGLQTPQMAVVANNSYRIDIIYVDGGNNYNYSLSSYYISTGETFTFNY